MRIFKRDTIAWVLIFLFLLVASAGAFTKVWDEDAPAGSDNPRSGDDEIRDTRYGVRERLAMDHVFEATESSGKIGDHHTIHLSPKTNLGTGATDDPLFGCQYVSGVPELFFVSEDDTDVQITSGGALKPHTGGIVQVRNTITGAVATGTTAMPDDNSIPQITEGDEYMTLAITPKSATNKLLIDVVIVLAHSAVDTMFTTALFQDATAGALAATQDRPVAINAQTVMPLTHYMTTGTTSTTTFRVRAGMTGTGATTTFNGVSGVRKMGGVMASSITLTEIQQ